MVSETVENGKKTLGIIGGMGPLATVDIFNKIISLTDADRDEGHIHILIDNNPKIPDRTKAVLEGSDAPFPYILETAKRLKQMGADMLLMPCNTSHVYYDRLCESVGLPIINMIEETAKYVSDLKLETVGLLATNGTIHARLYEKALEKYDVRVMLPSESGQRSVMALIYDGVKAGADKFNIGEINKELDRMVAKKAEVFILGCTELPIAFQKYNINFKFIDPGEVLAKTVVIRPGYRLRELK